MEGQLKPDDIRVGHCARISRYEYDSDPARADHHFENNARMAIAEFIRKERGQTAVEEFYVEKRLELYVASPKQFWELVHREAQQLAYRYAPLAHSDG